MDASLAHGDNAVGVVEARSAELADIFRWRREWSLNSGGPEGLGWDEFIGAAEAGGPGSMFGYRTKYRLWLGLLGPDDDVLAVLSIASDPNRNRESDSSNSKRCVCGDEELCHDRHHRRTSRCLCSPWVLAC